MTILQPSHECTQDFDLWAEHICRDSLHGLKIRRILRVHELEEFMASKEKSMTAFSVRPRDLFNKAATSRILEGFVDVRLGPATLESELKPHQKLNWKGKLNGDIGIAEIEIYEVRHLRIRTLSQEVLHRLGYQHWCSVTDKLHLQLNDEITIIFFGRNH